MDAVRTMAQYVRDTIEACFFEVENDPAKIVSIGEDICGHRVVVVNKDVVCATYWTREDARFLSIAYVQVSDFYNIFREISERTWDGIIPYIQGMSKRHKSQPYGSAGPAAQETATVGGSGLEDPSHRFDHAGVSSLSRRANEHIRPSIESQQLERLVPEIRRAVKLARQLQIQVDDISRISGRMAALTEARRSADAAMKSLGIIAEQVEKGLRAYEKLEYEQGVQHGLRSGEGSGPGNAGPGRVG